MPVRVGDVATFADARPDKEHALKPLEEAAEVYAAWREWHETDEALRRAPADGIDAAEADRRWALKRVAEECADVVQATCNLLASLGVEDFEVDMELCRRRNERRGRRCE